MNDEIDKINEINESYRKLHDYKSPGDQSGWKKSDITTPEEDQKRSIVDGILGDLENQRNDIDSIKVAMQQIANMVNEQTKLLNSLAQGQTSPSGLPSSNSPNKALNFETISAIGELIEKGASAYHQLKGGQSTGTPLIDQDTINKEMTTAFFDNLNTGKSINNFVKDALKRNATKKIVNSTMKALGEDAQREPHAPQ